MMTCPLAGEERVMSIESLVRHLSVGADPRCQGKIEHRLIDILVIAVCAVIACAESWDDIALYGRSKLAWLRTFLDLPNGIPSHDPFRRVFTLIDPDAFERGFAAWVGSLVDGFEREVIAIDGKTLRRSFDRRREGPDGVDAPRRPQRARVGVLEPTPGGVHEPGQHRRPRSRQAHLSAPWG